VGGLHPIRMLHRESHLYYVRGEREISMICNDVPSFCHSPRHVLHCSPFRPTTHERAASQEFRRKLFDTHFTPFSQVCCFHFSLIASSNLLHPRLQNRSKPRVLGPLFASVAQDAQHFLCCRFSNCSIAIDYFATLHRKISKKLCTPLDLVGFVAAFSEQEIAYENEEESGVSGTLEMLCLGLAWY